MKSIVDENLVSFKVLEQKALLGKRKALCRLNWKACGFIRRGNNSIQKSIPGCVYKIKKNWEFDWKIACVRESFQSFQNSSVSWKKLYGAWVISASVWGACIWGTHTATYLYSENAHASKLFHMKYGTWKNCQRWLDTNALYFLVAFTIFLCYTVCIIKWKEYV